jgi:hypothetical protein
VATLGVLATVALLGALAATIIRRAGRKTRLRPAA